MEQSLTWPDLSKPFHLEERVKRPMYRAMNSAGHRTGCDKIPAGPAAESLKPVTGSRFPA